MLLTLSRMLLAARNSPKSATNINSNEKVNTTCDYKERTSISTHGKSLRKETQDEEKTSPSKVKTFIDFFIKVKVRSKKLKSKKCLLI